MDIIYPPACICCGELLSRQEKFVCNTCKVKLPYLTEPCCLKCGKEIDSIDEEFCQDCTNHKRSYLKGFPVMEYKNPISDSLARFKYNNKKNYGSYFAAEIAKKHGRYFMELGVEALVPVPIHKNKLRKRGYNQAEVLAEQLGKLLNIPVDTGLIRRTINTLPQKELNNIKREENLRNAFISTGKIVKYNCVLLVDDIYTTGATIEACTKVLQNLHIKNIYYTSICIGKGN